MKFLLARHAEAESGPQMDPTRGLTDTGKKQIPIMADFLNAMDAKVGLILHSDMLRGRETAEGIAELLDVKTEQDPFVGPQAGDDGHVKPAAVKKAWKVIQKYARTVDDGKLLLVVSHGPLINALAAILLESGEGDKFHFSHGSIAKFDTEQPDNYEYAGRGDNAVCMHWMATPKLMKRAMKHEPELIEAALRVADAALAAADVHLEEEKGAYYYDEVGVKRWILGDGGKNGNCEACEEAASLGWIDQDDTYDMFDEPVDGPPGHPHDTCDIEFGEKRKRVYV